MVIPIPAKCCCLDSKFDVREGVEYRLRTEGTWIDLNPPAVDAGGDPNPDPGLVRSLAAFAKRVPSAPYMALLGKIGDGKWFVIGNAESLVAERSGRLYCCANDVPGFYWNNKGEIKLEISAAAELKARV